MKKAFKWIQLLIAVALLTFLVIRYRVTFSEIRITDGNFVWLIPCLLITILCIPVLAGFRWHYMLNALGVNYPLSRLIRINFVSIFWGVLLPSADGFALIRAYILMRIIDTKAAIGSVILGKFMGVFCLFTLALLASLFLNDIEWIWILRISLVIIITGLIAIFMIVRKVSVKEGNGGNLPQRIMLKFRRLANLLAQANRTYLIRGIGFVLLVQLFGILNIHFLFLLFGHPLPFIQHLCFVPLIQTIALIPLTTSGFGIRESAFIFFYQRLNILPADLIAISILNFLIMAGIPALIGGILSIHDNIRKQDILAGGAQ